MMNFIKNYLLLVLMGLGFVFIIVLIIANGVPNEQIQKNAADQAANANPLSYDNESAPVDPALKAADTEPKAGEPKTESAVGEIVTVPKDLALDGRETTPLIIEKMDGSSVNFNVELAKTEAEWSFGFMERSNIADDRGMLFVFPNSMERSFWMKNVLIPLDVLFIDEEGLIHHIHNSAKPGDTTSLLSNGPVPYVLEIKGGMAEKLGIDVGDKVIHPDIRIKTP